MHWEPDGRTLRNLRPVTHLDSRLAAHRTDPRLTAPAAELLCTDRVDPLTFKISFKCAHVGSEFDWHTNHTFLARFLGHAAREVVTALVLLDDATQGNGALNSSPGAIAGGCGRPSRWWPRRGRSCRSTACCCTAPDPTGPRATGERCSTCSSRPVDRS